MEADGAIFVVVNQLIENTYICSSCKTSFFGTQTYENHGCSELSYEREFDWIVLFPGLLHIEMNMCKAFMKLNWDAFMKDIVTSLGFTSENALKYAKSCSDHHKTWDILQTTYFSFVDELLQTFLLYCKENKTLATIEKFWLWNQNVECPNIIYVQQMVFTYLDAVFLFRVGVRKNDIKAILVAQRHFMPLFYSRNHPMYQKIIASSFTTYVNMPDDLKEMIYNNISVSTTGNVDKNQGGDTCLEEINKKGKKYISPIGMPSEKDWLTAFRNLDNFENVGVFYIFLFLCPCFFYF